jgi:hypothetical protein
MVSRVPRFFENLLYHNLIPDEVRFALFHYGIRSADALYYRVPSSEALEILIRDRLRIHTGNEHDDGSGDPPTYRIFEKDDPPPIEEYLRSREAGAIRRTWENCKAVARGQPQHHACQGQGCQAGWQGGCRRPTVAGV